jgi:hypothetical protein
MLSAEFDENMFLASVDPLARCRIHFRVLQIGMYICARIEDGLGSTKYVAGKVRNFLVRNSRYHSSDYYDTVDGMDEVTDPLFHWDFKKHFNTAFFIQFDIPIKDVETMQGPLPLREVSEEVDEGATYICNVRSVTQIWKMYPYKDNTQIVSKIMTRMPWDRSKYSDI